VNRWKFSVIDEQDNPADTMPDNLERMRYLLELWRRGVDAQGMPPNPNYGPGKAKRPT